MAAYNKVVLLGNIARNPELRYTPGSNLAVARTAIAVNHRYKDKEEVMFIDLVFFGKQAETIGEYVTKGSMLLVEGRISQNKWEQDGQKRSKHEIVVESFQFVGNRSKERGDDAQSGGAGFSSAADQAEEDDDIPF